MSYITDFPRCISHLLKRKRKKKKKFIPAINVSPKSHQSKRGMQRNKNKKITSRHDMFVEWSIISLSRCNKNSRNIRHIYIYLQYRIFLHNFSPSKSESNVTCRASLEEKKKNRSKKSIGIPSRPRKKKKSQREEIIVIPETFNPSFQV